MGPSRSSESGAPERSRTTTGSARDIVAFSLLLGLLLSSVEVSGATTDLRLALSSQLALFAWIILLNAAVAVGVAAGAIFLGRFAWLKAIWPGWLVAGGLLLLYLSMSTFAILPMALQVVAATSTALIATLLATLLGRRLPTVERVCPWALLTAAVLVATLLRIGSHAPSGHGLAPSFFTLWLPVALGAAAVVLFAARGRARWIVLATLVVMAALHVGWLLDARPEPSADSPRNVLLISIDTLRRDHVGCYGNDWIQTPTIDALAARGTLFADAFSPFARTNPSHSTMLTGLHPGRHGVIDNRPLTFSEEAEPLAELLAQEGYRTAAFVGGYTLVRTLARLSDSFEVYDDHLGRHPTLPRLLADRLAPRLYSTLLRLLGRESPTAASQSTLPRKQRDEFDRRAEVVVSESSAWLRSNADRPFFLFVHLYDPHGPYEAPPPYDAMYTADGVAGAAADWWRLSDDERLELLANPAAVQYFEASYAGEITYTDAQIGRLLGAMSELELWDETLVILTSDHGESLTEHGYYFDHGLSVYDPSIRIPLVIAAPGASVARVDAHVELVDLYPTVLEFAGLEGPTGDGESLLPLTRDESARRDARTVRSVVFPEGGNRHRRLLSLRTAEHKYIVNLGGWDDSVRVGTSEELYDLLADPGETRNIVDEAPEIAARYRELAAPHLDAWFRNRRDDDDAPLSEEAREGLRALGYLGE